MKGIDISSHNSKIDFKKVKKAGIEIVYIKATEGRSYINPLMKNQYEGAKSAGLHIGFYHYMRTNDPVIEAKFFLDTIKAYKTDCRDVIDIEDSTLMNSSASDRCNKFAQYMIKNSRDVMVYTGDYFYKDYLKNKIATIAVWIANYSANSPQFATGYYGFQYTDKGKVNGIEGYVDLDSFDEKVICKKNSNNVRNDTKKNVESIVYGHVTASVLNVRDGAGTNFKIIGTIKKGTVVKIDKRYSTKGWYSIYYGSHGGFVSKDYVKLN